MSIGQSFLIPPTKLSGSPRPSAITTLLQTSMRTFFLDYLYEREHLYYAQLISLNTMILIPSMLSKMTEFHLWLNNIAVCTETIFSLSIHQLVSGHIGSLHLLASVNSTAGNTGLQGSLHRQI